MNTGIRSFRPAWLHLCLRETHRRRRREPEVAAVSGGWRFSMRRRGVLATARSRDMSRRHMHYDRTLSASAQSGSLPPCLLLEPEPLIVPIVIANFDRKITRTTLVAHVHAPFRLSDHVPKPIQDGRFSRLSQIWEAGCAWVREAVSTPRGRPPVRLCETSRGLEYHRISLPRIRLSFSDDDGLRHLQRNVISR